MTERVRSGDELGALVDAIVDAVFDDDSDLADVRHTVADLLEGGTG